MESRSIWLLGGLFAAVALFFYTRTKQGSAVLESVSQSVGTAAIAAGEALGVVSRGLRDNNPGNVRRSADAWQGALTREDIELSGQTWDSAFVQFLSLGYGIRALSHVLQTYANKYHLNTVEGIISRYAPPEDDNDTESYIAEVADRLGVNPRQ